MKNHHLLDSHDYKNIRVERRPLRDPKGEEVAGLHNWWIALDNPSQLNSYTTAAIKEVILAFREASCDRACVAVVFTGTGDRSFCTGGNTKEYAEYYSGNPQEYKQYMRLFNDMVTQILLCDKPVINRVNGLRIAGGQEIGMACDFSIAVDTARFGQAGPKHGSAPDGGSTDFLHLFVGVNRAIESCTLCEHWSAPQAMRLGLINKIVPIYRDGGGNYVPNPMIIREENDGYGNPIFGQFKTGVEKEAALAQIKGYKTDLTALDREVEKMSWSLSQTMPDCLAKTLESMRKKKLEHWQRNCETNRSWLALNMMTEAKAGFTAFNLGNKERREVDFIELRRALAAAHPWNDELLNRILPPRG